MSHRRPYKVVSFCFKNRTTSAPGWRALAVDRGRSACECFTSAEMDLLDLASGGVTVTASSQLRCGSRVSRQWWNGVHKVWKTRLSKARACPTAFAGAKAFPEHGRQGRRN